MLGTMTNFNLNYLLTALAQNRPKRGHHRARRNGAEKQADAVKFGAME
jgi:hypothetical protein